MLSAIVALACWAGLICLICRGALAEARSDFRERRLTSEAESRYRLYSTAGRNVHCELLDRDRVAS